MPSEQEQLQERLKWLKEVQRLKEVERNIHVNKYYGGYKRYLIPNEYQDYIDLRDDELERMIQLTRRDLQDLERGEFEQNELP